MNESKNKYEVLKLKNQLCFPLYAASNAIIRKYKPYLDDIDLTYTQYLVMMILWEEEDALTKTLSERLKLNSGTLSPLLKKLEEKGYVERFFLEEDQRNLIVTLTEKGAELKEKAVNIPNNIAKEFNLEPEEAMELYRILYKIIE